MFLLFINVKKIYYRAKMIEIIWFEIIVVDKKNQSYLIGASLLFYL